MLVILVSVKVKSESIEGFLKETLENTESSVKEPGVARFDIIQQVDDPTQFILIEAYRSTEAPAQHKETAHYKKWRDAVEKMMLEPRRSVRFTNIYPENAGWG